MPYKVAAMGLQQGAPSHIQNIEAILERGDQLGFKLSIPSESSLDTPLIVLLGWLGCQVNQTFKCMSCLHHHLIFRRLIDGTH